MRVMLPISLLIPPNQYVRSSRNSPYLILLAKNMLKKYFLMRNSVEF